MRIRLHPSVVKLVNKHKGPLSANAEVNRALVDHYTNKKDNINMMALSKDALENLLGKTNSRRFLRTE